MSYTCDGERMSMQEMRWIVEVLGYGPVAYHLPVADILRILREDGRKIEPVTFGGV